MLKKPHPLKRGPRPQGFVDLKVGVSPELSAMVHQIALTTGISKSAIVRDALAKYGEAIGYLPEGTAETITPTRTRLLGNVPANKKKGTS